MGYRIEISETMASRALLSVEPEPVMVATFRADDGEVVSFSRYADEDVWVIDSHFTAKGFPVFCNGTGSRCTGYRYADESLAAEIDAAVADYRNGK